MVEAEGVEVKFTADDKDVNARLDNLERRLDRAKEKGKKGGKEAGNAFFGGFAGGVAGVLAGGVAQSGPVNAIFDLLMNVVGAALLPLLNQLVPVVKGITDVIGDIQGNPYGKAALEVGTGAAIGGRFGGIPGAIAGTVIAAGLGVKGELDAADAKKAQEEAAKSKQFKDMENQYNNFIANREDTRNPFEQFFAMNALHDMTAYEEDVFWRQTFKGTNREQDSLKHFGADVLDPQEPGRPYHPAYPPPNVGELHGPTVVNQG